MNKLNTNSLSAKNQIDIAYFISFCIEQYKHSQKMSGTQAMKVLDEYGVLNYLQNNFEVLHTQSIQWILEDIQSFIDLRKKNASFSR